MHNSLWLLVVLVQDNLHAAQAKQLATAYACIPRNDRQGIQIQVSWHCLRRGCACTIRENQGRGTVAAGPRQEKGMKIHVRVFSNSTGHHSLLSSYNERKADGGAGLNRGPGGEGRPGQAPFT